jgi:hypothetical protein
VEAPAQCRGPHASLGNLTNDDAASDLELEWCAGGAGCFGETLETRNNPWRSRAFRFNHAPATRWLRARGSWVWANPLRLHASGA